MPADEIPMTTGVFKQSDITFHCAPGKSNGPIIRLGVLAELAAGDCWALGLIARTELNDFEREVVGEMGRRMLANPYDYLVQEFDEAWEKAPQREALEFLMADHPHSLRFETPERRDVPRRIFVEGKPVRPLVLFFLAGELEERAASLAALKGDELDSAVPATDLITEVKKAA